MSTELNVSDIEEEEEFHVPRLHDSDDDSDNEVNCGFHFY